MTHEHEWGDVETSRFSGTVHRKCKVYGCNNITLDLDNPEEEDEEYNYNGGTSCCGDYHYADCPIRTG